ncbi:MULTISPECIES: phosphate/phosphonate ABC transporter permease [Vagococcus]|uniref:Phosphonate ABC transporter permease protein phnE1 (TC 3.A.1.9.1) n=1 Tax=Vagococcus fluvialis bH819 TaxID=1255619 RepID=A0A1X6WS32_9ENTE|nr:MULTISPECIES: phosphate/phosphonate ABC transporter permease [Vagococcus]SLM87163.1 Phosphonate ABC transporter permease protein phnE1 (TC 3.A.1.9.1) [Vagococcus fluvialis bH819]HCM90025.1 phosphate/phosphonate ABC transporter permease [Vagococcus sp.]
MNQSIRLSPIKNQMKLVVSMIFLTGLFIVSTMSLKLDFVSFFERWAQAGEVIRNFLVLDMAALPEIIEQLLVSVAIAIASLLIGAILSFIFAILGASNIAPFKSVSFIIKSCVSVIRAIPSLVWVLMIVASLGFGSIAGVVALVFSTVGYLTKSFISSIEEVSEEMIETMKATGASYLQIVFESVLPNVLNSFTSWIAIRLEANVAESISLGMLGAGGIGTVLSRAISSYNYGKISMTIISIFLTMVLFEFSVNYLKKKQLIG